LWLAGEQEMAINSPRVQSEYVGRCKGSVGGLAGLEISFVAMQPDPCKLVCVVMQKHVTHSCIQ